MVARVEIYKGNHQRPIGEDGRREGAIAETARDDVLGRGESLRAVA